MKHELLDLYNAALSCDDQSAIIQYKDAKNRIAPSIVMDLILDEIDREKLLNEMAEALEKVMDVYYGRDKQDFPGQFAKMAELALQRYREGR